MRKLEELEVYVPSPKPGDFELLDRIGNIVFNKIPVSEEELNELFCPESVGRATIALVRSFLDRIGIIDTAIVDNYEKYVDDYYNVPSMDREKSCQMWGEELFLKFSKNEDEKILSSIRGLIACRRFYNALKNSIGKIRQQIRDTPVAIRNQQDRRRRGYK